MTDTLVAGQSTRRAELPVPGPWAILAVVLTGQFMAVLDASVVNVAAPSIHADLHTSGAGLQLVIAGYVITYAVLLVTGARLGDILGHRRMFLSGLALFTLASLGCGLAVSTGMLIALRFIQGAGAAVMIPQVLSLIQRSYTGMARARPMRLYAAVLAGGAVAGQVIGGVMVSADLLGSTWRPVFLLNVPIGVILFVAGLRFLPKGRGEPGRSLDLAGVATGVVALFCVMAVFGGFFFALALHLQGGLGDSAMRAGLTFAPAGLAFAFVSLNWQRVPAKWHLALIISGFAANAAGLLLLAEVFRGGDSGGWLLLVAMVLSGAGMAAAFSPLMTGVVMRVPVTDAADATGVIVTVNQLALVVGVATFGTLYLNLAGRLPAHLVPGSFRLLSAHAEIVTLVVLAVGAVAGGVLASVRGALAAR